MARTALEAMMAARWEQYLPEQTRAFLLERARTDVHVHALIAALMHESQPEAVMALLADTICRMSQMNEHLTKIATDLSMRRPAPFVMPFPTPSPDPANG